MNSFLLNFLYLLLAYLSLVSLYFIHKIGQNRIQRIHFEFSLGIISFGDIVLFWLTLGLHHTQKVTPHIGHPSAFKFVD